MLKERRYDLDWLRVLVFGLLIFFHVGMLFVPWGFHIKNNDISHGMVWPMLFVNQWRLASLFLISGMGTRYALSHRSAWVFSKERIWRLLIPLLFGMIFIIAPQVYVERIVDGDFSGNYFQFFPSEYFQGIYPEGNLSWHHLWFLPYLLIYSLISVPVFIYLREHPDCFLLRKLRSIISKSWGLFVFIIPLYFVEAFIEPHFPVTHALIGDWFTLINFYLLYIYGYILISIKEDLWEAVIAIKKSALIIGIIFFGIQVAIWSNGEDSILIHYSEAFIKVTNYWSWILVILGYGATYLNKPSKILSYCNTAVYPFYILHQTVMIIAAYFFINLEMHLMVKFVLLSIITFGVSWVLYEIIRRISWLRPLFGLKPTI